MRTPFIAGNWKMYKTTKEAEKFAVQFRELYTADTGSGSGVRTAICAPFTQIAALVKAFDGTPIGVGAQNVHYEKEGAYTGEISTDMLEEAGVDYCIVGHSERRQYFNETDETVNLKLKALFKTDIVPIMCVGESLPQREKGMEKEVVSGQVRDDLSGLDQQQVQKLVIAYEPVWAIGTGKTATPEQANDMCACIRNTVSDIFGSGTADKVIIQYGGSVKPENVTAIMKMEEIDGALVGGASLDAEKFAEIIHF